VNLALHTDLLPTPIQNYFEYWFLFY